MVTKKGVCLCFLLIFALIIACKLIGRQLFKTITFSELEPNQTKLVLDSLIDEYETKHIKSRWNSVFYKARIVEVYLYKTQVKHANELRKECIISRLKIKESDGSISYKTFVVDTSHNPILFSMVDFQ